MEAQELLTIHEAAQWLGVGDTAVCNARGRLESQVRYGRILIRLTDLQAYKAAAKPGRPPKSAGAGQEGAS
jgi:hypothetical protein